MFFNISGYGFKFLQFFLTLSLFKTVDDGILLDITKVVIRYCSTGNSGDIFKLHFPAFKIASQDYFFLQRSV
jgi:hypothetical protein